MSGFELTCFVRAGRCMYRSIRVANGGGYRDINTGFRGSGYQLKLFIAVRAFVLLAFRFKIGTGDILP